MRLFAILMIFSWGLAHAADPGPELFEALDLNGDGFVTLSEAAGNEVVVTRFDRADRDRDGKLTPKEFARLKTIKVRVAKSKKEKDEQSAATGSSPKSVRKDKTRAASGG